jgi:hypothetical protein
MQARRQNPNANRSPRPVTITHLPRKKIGSSGTYFQVATWIHYSETKIRQITHSSAIAE